MLQPRVFFLAAAILVLLVVGGAHAQQPTLPDTPAGRALAEWLEAFNSADRDRIVAFNERYRPGGPPTEAVLQFRAQTGGFDVLSVTKSEPRHIEFVAKERNSPTRANGVLDLTDSDPPQVRGPMMMALPPDASRVLSGDELKTAQASVPFQRFSAWLEAFNTSDRSRMASFLANHWPSRNVEQEMSFRARTGGFELRALQEVSANAISGFVEDRESEEFASFTLSLEPGRAGRIANLNLRLMPRPPGFELPRLSETDLVESLRARLEKDAAADRFSGAMLMTKGGRTLFSGAYGLADRDKKIANTLDTRFRIGSMNKMFTGTAILQLVQAGKIKLTDPLSKYLPNYPNQTLANKVTIHHLLTHTGGTGDIFGPEFAANRLTLRTHDDYVSLYGKRDLLFEPGSRWQYSNYGMLLLGVVIERVSGMSYYDYVSKNIYARAGMTRTGSQPESENVPGLSVGYTRPPDATEWRPNTDTLPFRGTSAGGGYSTVGDLVKFAEALLSHKLLDEKHTALLISGKADLPGGQARYAYGFEEVRGPDGRGAVGHGGGAPGMNGELRIFPELGLVVAVLANLDPPAASRVWGFVETRH